MIKQTLMFTSPVALTLKYGQLVVTSKEDDKTLTRPIEDIGFVIIDHPMISLTVPLLNELTENNVAVIFCNNKQMPHSMLMPLDGNTTLQESYKFQILSVTDKQYGDIVNFWGKNERNKKNISRPVQLEIIW